MENDAAWGIWSALNDELVVLDPAVPVLVSAAVGLDNSPGVSASVVDLESAGGSKCWDATTKEVAISAEDATSWCFHQVVAVWSNFNAEPSYFPQFSDGVLYEYVITYGERKTLVVVSNL